MKNEQEYMTLNEVSKMMRVSARTIYRMVAKKEIPYIKFGGSIRFSKDEILKMVNKKAVMQRPLHNG